MTVPYPKHPGFKERGSTSEDAARSVGANRARALRDVVLNVIQWMPRTADEVAQALGMNVLTIRPRVAELRRMGKIEPSGARRPNASGKKATVWTTTGW
jgi:predicted ArsR family transcriptional regulator